MFFNINYSAVTYVNLKKLHTKVRVWVRTNLTDIMYNKIIIIKKKNMIQNSLTAFIVYHYHMYKFVIF
jgi:hypothetical protein